MVQVQPPTPKPQEIVSFWGLPTDTNSNPWSMLLPNSNQPPQQAGGESESWKWWISSWQMLRYTPMTQGRPNSAAYLLPTNMGNIKWPFFCLVSWHGSKNYHIGNFQMRKQSNNLHQMSDSLVGYIAVFSSVGCFQRFFFFAAPSAQSVRFVSRRNFRLPCGRFQGSAGVVCIRVQKPGSLTKGFPYKQPWKFEVCSMKKSFYLKRTGWSNHVKHRSQSKNVIIPKQKSEHCVKPHCNKQSSACFTLKQWRNHQWSCWQSWSERYHARSTLGHTWPNYSSSWSEKYDGQIHCLFH